MKVRIFNEQLHEAGLVDMPDDLILGRIGCPLVKTPDGRDVLPMVAPGKDGAAAVIVGEETPGGTIIVRPTVFTLQEMKRAGLVKGTRKAEKLLPGLMEVFGLEQASQRN